MTKNQKPNRDSKTEPAPGTDALTQALRALIQEVAAKTPAPAPTPAAAPTTRAFVGKPPCSEPGCDKPTYAKGMCTLHYHRKLRHRDVAMPERVENAVHVATSVENDVYRAIEARAKSTNLSMFRTVREILTEWAAKESKP